jgi:hypothetical protein
MESMTSRMASSEGKLKLGCHVNLESQQLIWVD